MDIPRWKKWLSYLFEWHLESAPSSINPHLYVSLRNGRFQLSTAKAVYSYDDLYDNFTGAFKQFDFEKLPGNHTLILGLGLGSVPYMLEHKFEQQLDYTAVEIDEHVIYLAHKYSLDRIHSPLEIICADAMVWVPQCTEKFDLIVMDIFLEDIIPGAFQQSDFLTRLADLLCPGGVLLYNRLASQPRDREENRTFYREVFKPVFPKAAWIEVKGNWILFSDHEFLKGA